MKKLGLLAGLLILGHSTGASAAESGCSMLCYRYYAVQSRYAAAFASSDGLAFGSKHAKASACGASRNMSMAVAKSEALARCAASAKKFKVVNHCAIMATHM